MIKSIKKGNILLLLVPLCYLAVSVFIVMTVCRNGYYPEGRSVIHHIYRGDLIYKSIKAGNWWPVYDPMWYNGTEPLRYFAPFPAFFMALCQALTGGSVFYGYLLFIGLICFFGGMAWFFVGCRRGRPWFGAVIGLLWFFVPCNVNFLFTEGNLPLALALAFLPVAYHSVQSYLDKPEWKRLPAVTLSFVFLGTIHMGFSMLTALALMLFCVIKRIIAGKSHYASIDAAVAMLLSFAVLGIWLWGALTGSFTAQDHSVTMSTFFQDAGTTLNPIARLNGDRSIYFGLAAFVIAIFGGICGRKQSMPGFLTALFLFLTTTTLAYPIVAFFPWGEYLWMLRLVPVALCMILYSLLVWKDLRKTITLVLIALLFVDAIPSLRPIYGNRSGLLPSNRLDQMQITTLVGEGQTITKQRLALLDESGLGPEGAWLVSSYDSGVPGSFGGSLDVAATADNLSQLNRALVRGHFLYMFDRCLELGNDSVVVLTTAVSSNPTPAEELDSAAARLGYKLAERNEAYRLYHLDTEGNWGTAVTYRAIAIGSQASEIALEFPAMREAPSSNLNDYTFEELSAYDIIYLAGFTYDDRAYAEEMILALSEAGVHIVIAADGIPEDRQSHDQSFLGVVCNFIEFKNGYPMLDTVDGILYTDYFPADHTDWETVYLEGLDKVWGSAKDDELELDFYGTVKNDNIVMIGLNLPYFCGLTGDRAATELLSRSMQLSNEELPRREVVPLEIKYGSRTITVTAPQYNVNTGLAYLDVFDSDRPIREDNHLTVVDRGTTKISIQYPHFWPGLCVSVIGVLLVIAQWVYVRKREKWSVTQRTKKYHLKKCRMKKYQIKKQTPQNADEGEIIEENNA